MKITRFLRAAKRREAVDDERATKQERTRARAKQQAAEDAPEHVPEFIYRTVKYARKGESDQLTSPVTKKVADYIQTHFVVPKDFERDHKFGPHSGLTFEKRLARAYSLYLLEPTTAKSSKSPSALVPPICIACAAVGHTYKECPDGF